MSIYINRTSLRHLDAGGKIANLVEDGDADEVTLPVTLADDECLIVVIVRHFPNGGVIEAAGIAENQETFDHLASVDGRERRYLRMKKAKAIELSDDPEAVRFEPFYSQQPPPSTWT